jgi:hypothetical protein
MPAIDWREILHDHVAVAAFATALRHDEGTQPRGVDAIVHKHGADDLPARRLASFLVAIVQQPALPPAKIGHVSFHEKAALRATGWRNTRLGWAVCGGLGNAAAFGSWIPA